NRKIRSTSLRVIQRHPQGLHDRLFRTSPHASELNHPAGFALIGYWKGKRIRNPPTQTPPRGSGLKIPDPSKLRQNRVFIECFRCGSLQNDRLQFDSWRVIGKGRSSGQEKKRDRKNSGES